MNIPKEIEIINFHLSENKNSFLSYIFEQNIFSSDLYYILLESIKHLHDYDIYKYIKIEYTDCVWWNFISNILHTMYILTHTMYSYWENWIKLKNISNSEFHEYLEELIYEFQSLFAWWDKDYQWQHYKQKKIYYHK